MVIGIGGRLWNYYGSPWVLGLDVLSAWCGWEVLVVSFFPGVFHALVSLNETFLFMTLVRSGTWSPFDEDHR